MKSLIDTLKPGDLVLIPYSSGNNIPKMVLAKFDTKTSHDTFYSQNLRVLVECNDIMPPVVLENDDIPTLFSKLDHPTKNCYEVFTKSQDNPKVYTGIENILTVLDNTPGYSPHASSLRESFDLHRSRKIDEIKE